MRTHVYIDGFNLYYGAVKGTPFYWLNVAEICRLLLPGHEIRSIKYFSAIVGGRPNDPNKPLRQQIFFRALRTLPNLKIILGHFLSHPVRMPLLRPASDGSRFAEVIKTEEKGSDVNLATHILHDAHLDAYDTAVLVSNDSDLLEPLKIVRAELGKKVGVLNPQKHPSRVLQREADFFKQIRPGLLAKCLFPVTLRDSDGEFHMPPEWAGRRNASASNGGSM